MRKWSISILIALVLSAQLYAKATDATTKPKLPPAPAGVVIRQDVDYLDADRNEKLDLYLPADRKPGVRSPAVVIIHGGGWVGGDKASSREFNVGTTLAKAGYVCASVNYQMTAGKRWPTNVLDCKNAVRFLRKNKETFQVDAEHLGVIGGSAGGHLALMVAYTRDIPELEPKTPYPDISDDVDCVVDMYGITDVLTRRKTDKEGNSIGEPGQTNALLTQPRDGHEDLWKLASPVYHVSDKTVPTLILHGTADTTVDRDQATELADRLKQAGVEHKLIMIPGVGHTFDLQSWNHKPLPMDLRPIVVGFFDKHLKPKKSASIQWDPSTLRFLAPGGYPRMIHLGDGATLFSCETDGRSFVRRSDDDGRSWSAPVEAAKSAHASAANPQPLHLKSGTTLLFFNERPHDRTSDFAICLSTSTDGGRTWSRREKPIYRADHKFENGCWEPSAVQLQSDEVVLFFASESPYRQSEEQEITQMRSSDDGANWSEPRTFSFRKGARGGMPVPLMLQNGRVVVAIEDTGENFAHKLQPAILSFDPDCADSITANDARRRPAVTSLAASVYAGAPYLAQFSTGQTLLSCQSDESRRSRERMIVYVGNSDAQEFQSGSSPFDLPRQVRGQWNSLFVRGDDTVVALSSTSLNKRPGVWAIDGRFVSCIAD